MKYETVMRGLVEYLARKASAMTQRYKLEDLVSPSIAPLLDRSFDKLCFSIIKEKNGALWCRLCDKGPFTKRGLYLHLIRVHADDLEFMIEEEMKKLLEVVKR